MSRLLSVLIASLFAVSLSLDASAAGPTKTEVKVEKAEATEMKADAKANANEAKKTAAASEKKAGAKADYALAEKNAKADYKAASVDCKTKPSTEQKTCLSDAKAARVKTIADAKAAMVKAVAESKAAKKAAGIEADASRQKAGADASTAKEKAKEPSVVNTASPAVAVDETAALALVKSSKCLSCHSVDKDKKGPAFKKIAATFKGRADGESKVSNQITASPKFSDGSGDHPVVDTKDPAQIKNLANWILTR